MTERLKSTRDRRGRPRLKSKRMGRPPGGESEFKRVARARAERAGRLPDEMLLEWARTGRMEFVPKTGKRYVVDLEPSDRIACAKACAKWYKPEMPAWQPRPAPGEPPPVVRLEIDPKMLEALGRAQPDRLEAFRDLLKMVQAAGGDLAGLASRAGGDGPDADPARYGRMLSEASDVEGSA